MLIYPSKAPNCELSLDPEVATLFGREIGQSNGDILLTICDDSKDKSRPQSAIYNCFTFPNDYFYELIGWRKSDIFPV